MLVQVLEMIKTTGHLIVVEGVETEARLDLLRATGIAHYVQGYEISRPLGIDEFIAFLGRDKIAPRCGLADPRIRFTGQTGRRNGRPCSWPESR
jgi:predicted signal transduction protein with EAL and GGDEF domain